MELEEHIRGTMIAINEKIDRLNQVLGRLQEVLSELNGDAVKTPKRGRKRKTREQAGETIDSEPSASGPAVVPENNQSLTPLDNAAVQIGKTLSEPFTPTDLRSRLDGAPIRANNWIAAWKRQGWIETCGFGQYRRTKTFGE